MSFTTQVLSPQGALGGKDSVLIESCWWFCCSAVWENVKGEAALRSPVAGSLARLNEAALEKAVDIGVLPQAVSVQCALLFFFSCASQTRVVNSRFDRVPSPLRTTP